jgi:hypothetical protein
MEVRRNREQIVGTRLESGGSRRSRRRPNPRVRRKGRGHLHFIARSYFPGLGAKRQRENVLALTEIRSC